MKITINETSRKITPDIRNYTEHSEFFKAFEKFRADEIRLPSDWLNFAKITQRIAGTVSTSLSSDITTVTPWVNVAHHVMDCYQDYLSIGRIYPYETYLAVLPDETKEKDSQSFITPHVRKELDQTAQRLTQLKFSSQEDIIQSASALYVILAAAYGWETLDPVPPTEHLDS